MERQKHILVVFPHPDDEAFGTAGYLSLQSSLGTPITYICATLGEMGRNMGKPFFANRETLPEIRRREIHDACNVIGIEDLRLLGLRDKTLEFEDVEYLADIIEGVINEVKPSLIITFYPGYAVHPDHDATGEAAITAIRRIPKEERPVVFCKAFSNNCVEELGEPDVVFDVTAAKENKIAAIKAHRSQTEGMFDRLDKMALGEDVEGLRWLLKEEFWTYKF